MNFIKKLVRYLFVEKRNIKVKKIYFLQKRIDFFSLDVEGAEEAVLNTLPWDKVNIQSVLIEVSLYTVMLAIGFLLFILFKLATNQICTVFQYTFFNFNCFLFLSRKFWVFIFV